MNREEEKEMIIRAFERGVKLGERVERERIIEMIKRSKPKEKTWGGYDGEGIVDDKEAFGYNQAIFEYEDKILIAIKILNQ